MSISRRSFLKGLLASSGAALVGPGLLQVAHAATSDQAGQWKISGSHWGAFRARVYAGKVQEIKALGKEGGAGHLIICEIVKLHLSEDILDEESRIDPHKIDLVGRLGRAFYSRASGDAVFKVFQPVPKLVIGYDALPDFIKNSEVLTGNNLGQIAGLFEMPTLKDKSDILKNKDVQKLMRSDNVKYNLHRFAKQELEKENTVFATQILLFAETHD